MNKRRLLQITTLSLSLFALPALAQRTLHVNINTGDDANDGLKWSTAFKNIQPAINAAAQGDIIYVAAGTYYPTQKISNKYGSEANPTDSTTHIDRSFLLKKDIKLYGGFPTHASDATTITDRDWTLHQTTLSGDFNNDDKDNFENMDDNALHVVVMINPTSDMEMDGFHITGGGGDEGKITGTIYVDGTPVMQSYGGGIYAIAKYESSPVLSNLVIKNNRAVKDGGGFYNYSESGFASPTLTNVTIINNFAEVRGGGFYNDGMHVSATFKNVTIAGNEALEGGGLTCIGEKDCSPQLENVLISGNKANKSGGVYIWAIESNAHPSIVNTTICGNIAHAGTSTGGILVLSTAGEAKPYIKNSVIWGNKANTVDNIYVDGGGGTNPVYSYSFVEKMDLGETNLNGNTDPMFIDPIDADFAPTTSDFGDYQLLPTSPLINKGNNADATLSYDLAGQNRIYGDIVDIGAYEAQNIDLVDNKVITAANPTIWGHQDNLYVKVNHKTATVRVYNTSGILIKQINDLGEGTHTLSLPAGLYIVTLNTGETAKIFIR